jgi:hypothetical protein
MRKFLILCAALFCISLTASAQDSTAAFDASSPEAEPPAPVSLIPASREPWQVGVSFQYQQYNVLGLKFHNLAYQGVVTRYLSNWFGVEGTAITGFGSTTTTPSTTAKSLFLGGGPHLVIVSTNHLEPWVHVNVGWERFRFTQGPKIGVNSHAAFLAGGGLDYKIRSGRLFWRVQGDFFGTNLGPTFSKDYFVGTGLVLNF